MKTASSYCFRCPSVFRSAVMAVADPRRTVWEACWKNRRRAQRHSGVLRAPPTARDFFAGCRRADPTRRSRRRGISRVDFVAEQPAPSYVNAGGRIAKQNNRHSLANAAGSHRRTTAPVVFKLSSRREPQHQNQTAGWNLLRNSSVRHSSAQTPRGTCDPISQLRQRRAPKGTRGAEKFVAPASLGKSTHAPAIFIIRSECRHR